MEDIFDNELVNKFEELLEENKPIYFDSDEFCEIICFYLDIFDYEYANKALEQALILYPENADLKIRQLEYFIGIEDLHNASILIEELKNVVSTDIDYLIATAKYWSFRGFPNRALEIYYLALKNKEDEDFIYVCIGNEYIDLKDFQQAYRAYKKALDYNINEEYAFFSCIHCLESLNKNEECIEFLKQYIDKNPYSEIAWYQLGLQYIAKEKYTEALNAFDYSILINQKSITGYIQKAFCYEKLGQWSKAIEAYEESIPFDDTAAFTYFKIGLVFIKMKKISAAIHSFHKALKDDPQFDKAWFELSKLHDALGNYEEALHFIKIALDIDAKNINYWKRNLSLYVQTGRYEEATSAFEKILDFEPQNLNIWLAYSELLISLGDYSYAISILEKGCIRFNSAELYSQLSNCYYLLNDSKKSEIYLNIALSLNPDIKEYMFEKYSILLRLTN